MVEPLWTIGDVVGQLRDQLTAAKRELDEARAEIIRLKGVVNNEIAREGQALIERDRLASTLGEIVMLLLQDQFAEARVLASGVVIAVGPDGTPVAVAREGAK